MNYVRFVKNVLCLGYILDGPDMDEYGSGVITVDIDYQRETTAVTTKFTGFESKLHGIISHEWAVGTTPRAEDVQPFTSAGIVLNDQEQVIGDGNIIKEISFQCLTYWIEPI